MAPDKRNHFLDAADSEEDQTDQYDSEAEELQKGGRKAKRRRVDEADFEDDEDDDYLSAEEHDQDVLRVGGRLDSRDGNDDDDDELENSKVKSSISTKNSSTTDESALSKPKHPLLSQATKSLSKKHLIASESAIRRSGVVYLSRIPPYMKPHKLRTLLQTQGTINRVFLSPEDPTSHTRRVRSGGNKKRLFTEGWVEFASKKDAKRACEMLNARPIGGKKNSYYHDDIWNLLYLKGFKWHNLTEQIAGENAERASRMNAEIGRTTRENKEFVRNVERAKVQEGMRSKREAQKRKRGGDGEGEGGKVGGEGGGATAAAGGGEDGRSRGMTFKQVPLARTKVKEEEQPEHVTRVLSKIF